MDLIAGRTSLHESEVVQGCAAELVLGMFTNCTVANLPILLSELQVGPVPMLQLLRMWRVV